MYNYNLGLHFKKICNQHPSSIALVIGKKKITFKYLDQVSDQLVNFLKKNKIFLNDKVCLSSKKELLSYALFIACLKIGASCTFLDRKSPIKRLNKIISTVNAKILIIDKELKKKIGLSKIKVKKIDYEKIYSSLKKIKTRHNTHEIEKIPSTTIAYIMFTSGSTGDPKGVAINHGNVINFINWSREEFKISSFDKVANLNPLFFDNSIFDIFGGLFNGARLIALNRTELIDPKNLIYHLEKNNMTIWFSVPSLLIYILSFNILTKKTFKNIRKIIFGGEPFPKNNLKKLYKIFKERCDLINVYGPTECTCICSSYKIKKVDFSKKEMLRLAPLGKSLSKNFYHMIVNKKFKEVPKGRVGELIIGGPNVGLGYFNNDEETNEKFIQNPNHHLFRDIVYRSGDFVYQDKKNDFIYYFSRKDNQVKFNGYRIELNEIEHAIGSIKNIIENIVTFGKRSGKPEITAWVAHNSSIEKIRRSLETLLPKYMIPTKFVEADKLPKNINGKIDKKLLISKYYD